ncbi:kinesin-like protein KIF15 [Aplochiton taeniatus]
MVLKMFLSCLFGDYSGDSDSIKVFVRVRPLTQGTGLTTDRDQGLCLTVTSPNTIRLHSKPDPRTFTYDHVAGMDVSQDSVFSCVAKHIVESCMNGYNGTIFAYGQTGSGKTFTMIGPSDSDNFSDDLRGVIPRCFEYLFFLIEREVERSGNSKSFLCKCSFTEIYNEQIYDLLDSASTSLFLRENIKKGVYVEGAVENCVSSAAEAYQVLSMGWRNRRVASTSMNRESSRSHAVFTMTLESKETSNEVVNIRTSQLNLVDLAGSERQKDTHTEGSRLKEASSINRSLMCLGQVIMALVDVSNGKSRHICYRDSKLTFLLRDSLGGNAKTYIIANVHPGSRCFGETLSTLHFAQRAKLIKNKAMVNEDTQGNVRQLQAEVKKLKEQLSQALAAPQDQDEDLSLGGPQQVPSVDVFSDASYKLQFMQAVRLWKKREEERMTLLQKVAVLEEAWAQKEKFVHSNRMIVRFREDHIGRLEQSLRAGQDHLGPEQSQQVVTQLREEILILRDQLEHHPKMTYYAAENYGLREEVRQLRALEAVIQEEHTAAQRATELEEAFHRALQTAQEHGDGLSCSTPGTGENSSAHSLERLKAQLLQRQMELTNTHQAFEEFKELSMKHQRELESQKRYLEKSNKHLENILEATNAHKKQEVSQLNKIHVETIKILTTPTKAYHLRTRTVPLSSPFHLNGGGAQYHEDIQSEQPPQEMTEMACEALTEELQQVQEQAGHVQCRLEEEELKNRKLLQQVTRLEEHIATVTQEAGCREELLSTERSALTREQLNLQESVSSLEQTLRSERQTGEVLRSEVQDLRLVLQSSDRELAAVKAELSLGLSEQQTESAHLSSSLISTQLQLNKVTLERECLLEQQQEQQDALDQLQAETKYELDQSTRQLEAKQAEVTTQQATIMELIASLQTEKEHSSTLSSQLQAHQESTSRELLETVEQNVLLKKQLAHLNTQHQQQVSIISDLEEGLASANGTIAILEQQLEQDKAFVLELVTQTRDVRSELVQKDQDIALLTGDIGDLTAKCNSVCAERQELTAQSVSMEAELQGLREAAERRTTSNQIEVELLQEEVAFATEEVQRLTKVLDEQAALLQTSKEQTTQKETSIQGLLDKLRRQEEAVEKAVRNMSATPPSQKQSPHTPQGFRLDLSQLLQSRERELESRRSSMMSMEVLLAELNAERTAKNQEIQRLTVQLNEKEIVRLEIEALLEKFYTKQNQIGISREVKEALNVPTQRALQEERANTAVVMERLSEAQERLQQQEKLLSQSQTCVQELTSELRNRCLELRELSLREQEEEKLQQEVEVLRKQVNQLSEENGKLVGHKNHRQKIEYLVKLKKDNTKLHEENEKLKSEMSVLRDNVKCEYSCQL